MGLDLDYDPGEQPSLFDKIMKKLRIQRSKNLSSGFYRVYVSAFIEVLRNLAFISLLLKDIFRFSVFV